MQFFCIQDSTINLKHYVSVVSQLVFKAAQIVKECAEDPQLKKYDKGGNDPVTDADFKIQTMLIRGITHFFPKLRIVGEESTDYVGQIDLDPSQLTLDIYPQHCQLDEDVPVDELCVWIDPIDNTAGFVKGDLEDVTILIGMSRGQLPYLGIIGIPYSLQNDKSIFKPYLNMGFQPKMKAFCINQEDKEWEIIQRPAKRAVTKLVSSKRKTNNRVGLIAEELSAELEHLKGSGIKINMVIEGKADALVYLGTGNCRWDSCAGEAIVKAMGGYFSDQHGNQIKYVPGEKNYQNETGNVCTLDLQLYTSIIETIKTFKSE